jgi:phosphoglycolate phosphatase
VKEPVRLLVFDLDGTLIDSKVDLANSVNHALLAFGLPALPFSVITSYVGDGATVLIRRAAGGNGDGRLEAILESFLSHYRRHLLDTTLPYPGVPETLRKWADRYEMALLTNKPLGMTQAILSGLALDRFFPDVVGGDSFPRKKPDPEGLLHLMKTRGASPGATLMVGDSRNDVLAGKRAGTRTCGVTYGLGAGGFADDPPDFTVARFSDLFTRIRPAP